MEDDRAMWSSGAYGYFSDYLLWWIVFTSVILHTWCFFKLIPSTYRPRLRLILGNGLIAICMFCVVGLTSETYLRFVSVETDAMGATLTTKRWKMIYPKLNSWYCRDDEWVQHKPSDVYRIAFVGDSFTYGWGINDENDRFTNLIQQKFNVRSNRVVEVMNVAWVDWDTQNEWQASQDIIQQYDVDEIVLCYLPNDIDKRIPTNENENYRKPPTSRWFNTDSSFLLDYLYYRVYAPRMLPIRSYSDWLWSGYMNEEVWKQHQADLTKIIDLCRNQKVILRAALLPLIKTSGGQYQPEVIHSRVTHFFEEHQVPTVDLLPAIQGVDTTDLVVNAHDPHPNEWANKLFAEMIWSAFYKD